MSMFFLSRELLKSGDPADIEVAEALATRLAERGRDIPFPDPLERLRNDSPKIGQLALRTPAEIASSTPQEVLNIQAENRDKLIETISAVTQPYSVLFIERAVTNKPKHWTASREVNGFYADYDFTMEKRGRGQKSKIEKVIMRSRAAGASSYTLALAFSKNTISGAELNWTTPTHYEPVPSNLLFHEPMGAFLKEQIKPTASANDYIENSHIVISLKAGLDYAIHYKSNDKTVNSELAFSPDQNRLLRSRADSAVHAMPVETGAGILADILALIPTIER